ncbi:MAG: hypothetical protein WC997_11315 [Porticoccaceae bacterium]
MCEVKNNVKFLLSQVFGIFICAISYTNADNLPPLNMYLADSPYPIAHVDATASGLARWSGPVAERSRTLDDNEIIFKPVGFADGFSYLYSGHYPNGRRAIFAGGADRITKLDADTLRTISTYVLREGPLYSEMQVENFFDDVDKLIFEAREDHTKAQNVYERIYDTMIPALKKGAGSIYKFVNNENELYICIRDPLTGQISIKVFGDSEAGNFYSPIVLKRSFDFPLDKVSDSLPMAMNVTYDGWIIAVMNDGQVFAVSPDFKKLDYLLLPEAQGGAGKSDQWMGGTVRNSIAIDDDGGIYIVSRVFLHRVQWTGSRLSLDTADGAWSVAYESGENGSGTTPTPIGWGKSNDLLVAMLDGVGNVNIYWRDVIPEDWEGIPGQPRRLAGTLPLTFGENTPDSFRIESSPVALGYGFFWPNDTAKNQPSWQGSFDKQLFANYTATTFKEHAVFGGAKYEWNPERRELEVGWITPLSLAPTICTPSINNLLYCIGRRENFASVEVINWQTGKSEFHYLIGDSYRYNPAACNTRVTEEYIEVSSVGSAILRLYPQKNFKK